MDLITHCGCPRAGAEVEGHETVKAGQRVCVCVCVCVSVCVSVCVYVV